jgi:hypothetical protein
MSILILNRGPLALRPYHEWFADYPDSLLLLASRADLERLGERLPTPADGYLHAEAVADYESGGPVRERARQLAREHRIEHVIACQEKDLECAGALRDEFGLPGQGYESALVFRDKLVMKRHATAAGIPVAEHATVETAADVRAFAAAHGLPVVIKPRDGFSSVGLRILRSAAELEAYVAADFARELGSPPNLLVEAYVDGEMYHIDGMVLDGSIVVAQPSHYLYQLGSFEGDHSPRVDVALDADDPVGLRLVAFVERVIGAFPTPEHTTFHALVLCEIASRNGGALIKVVLETMYGVNFPVAWPRASVGLPVPLPRDGRRLVPDGTAGQLLLLRRPGIVRAIPETLPFPWLRRYDRYVEPGQRSGPATSSGDFMVAMVAAAPDRVTCEQRLREAAAWFEEALDIAPLPEPQPVS